MREYDAVLHEKPDDGGAAFTGSAEGLPAGYGRPAFDREDEGTLFISSIRGVEEPPETASEGRYDDLMEHLSEGPYWIVDILPEQVSANAAGQYAAVERYFLQPERIVPLRRKYAGMLLRLNCYYDMAVSFDCCASWETNPDPEVFVNRVAGLSGSDFLRAVFAQQNAMIEYDHNDTYLTVYDPGTALLDKLRALAAAEGLFVWSPPKKEG